MARPLRIQYEGAIYHVMSRGDRREAIFVDDDDRERFSATLAEACAKTGWQVHAACLMDNHFHLVVETPQPNLSVGMKWLLGTYTQRFNRRHKHWGHLFGGRFKAQLIDGRSPGYLARACHYVHLNPCRAGLIGSGAPLESYRWSTYPAYLLPRLRPGWMRVDRLLGEHGLAMDTARSRRAFSRQVERMRLDPLVEPNEATRRGWTLGAEDFADWLSERLARPGRHGERAAERRETDRALAERLVRVGLAQAGWKEIDLSRAPKGDPAKVAIARRLRHGTPMTRRWIAERLQMGSASYVSALLASVDSKL